MKRLSPVRQVRDIRRGADPAFDAWFYTFRAENNIEHHINPGGVAADEQLRFMVALDENQVYVPCSDATFRELIQAYNERCLPPGLLAQYAQAWKHIMQVIRARLPGKAPGDVAVRERRRNVINYCRHRFLGSLALANILPSRLVKRLTATLLTQFEDEDPWAGERMEQNKRQIAFLFSNALRAALQRLPEAATRCKDISALRRTLDEAEFIRLLYLAAYSRLHLKAVMEESGAEAGPISRPLEEGAERGEGILGRADHFLPLAARLLGNEESRTFLYICDIDGGLPLDLMIIKTLLRLGHKVVLALKETPLHLAPTIWDPERDPLLAEHLPEHLVFKAPAASKNGLLQRLHERRLLIISDGTGERLNLYRTSVTFARAWKESDVVLAKGKPNKDVLLGTSHAFTRDIFCFWEEHGEVRMEFKARPADVRKFSEQALTAKARSIIRTMRGAKDAGKSVMFYSCVIGSIPGQTKTALDVAGAFVSNLREKQEDVFIINPGEYFEPGMDGDDLMFMWEQVQRSGLINIWRFQSVEDIETSFALLGRRVPPIWNGKDATFSTGCTKEMRIALDMQRSHPELQIIGPGPEKFFRRGEYGVGSYYDATLAAASPFTSTLFQDLHS